jgi:nucleotide-binding universal stress UspA family protein
MTTTFSLAGDVLLATDRTELAASAARVAVAIARRHGLSLRAVHAVDARAMPLPASIGAAIEIADEVLGPDVHAAQRDEVRASVAAAIGADVDWPVRLGVGVPADVVVRAARDAGVGLVVLGLRLHRALGRAPQDETALSVMRRAPCPVLGVVPSLDGLPRRAVVGVDFGAASHAAARLARALVAPGGTITLAHAPGRGADDADEGEARARALGTGAALGELRGELAGGGDVTVETVTLDATSARPAGEQLLDLAGRAGADLLAIGNHRRNAVERWLLGSVATDVARDGRVSVLLHP